VAGGGEQAAEAKRLRAEVRQAAQDRAFSLTYQPRRCLSTQALAGAEAQLRWDARRGGVVAGACLMQLLDETGQSIPVMTWALAEACRTAAGWDAGQVSVSLPGGMLHNGGLLTAVGRALAASGLPAERLEIAVPEAALAGDDEDMLFAVASLRDRGVDVALDEFGSTSGSLLVLKRLPLTKLKLDRSLVRDLPGDRDAGAVVVAATDFAHAVDVTVVACGVESEAQLGFLTRAGCDQAQGAVYGRSKG
jgi:EAL domain-containing protein (putative c-di-GMP-specific phosphodiesterase class I)